LAQETTPEPTPEATTQPTDNPTPTDTATPTDLATPTDPATPTPEETVTPIDSPEPTAKAVDASPTEIASPTPEVTPVATDLVTPTPSDTPAETQAPESNPTVQGPPASIEPSVEPSAEPSATPTITPTAVITNVLPETLQDNSWVKLIIDKLGYAPTEIEQVCLTDETPILDSTDTDWNRNDTTGISETKNKVELGVRYTFPQENKVSVLFKCLPKDESLRTSLKIQRIKISDLKLPEGVNPYGEYAFDITTGMQDGTFEYDVTLPKPENKTAAVSFMEETGGELQAVSEEKLNQEGDKVKVESLDHFTIFIATYADLGLVTSELAYLQGDTVYTNSTGLDSTKYYRVDIIEQNGTTRHSAAACITGVTSLSGSYLLSTSAPVGSNWKAEITQYNNSSNCANLSSKTDTGTASFEVKATSPTPLTNPTIPQTCGLDIALVIDNSNSISSTELGQMKTALTGFVSALSGTPTQFSVTKFGTNASVVHGFTSTTADVISAINSVSTGGGGTNWKEGIALARGTFDPRSTKANLMIFASDGDPTYPYCGGSMTCAADVNAAVVEANTTKQFPIRILALGIGEAVLDSGNGLRVENLKAISGHVVNGSTVLGSDVVTTNFSTMAADLATFASQTCGGTITVNKIVTGEQSPTLSGWHFTINGHDYVTDAQGLTQAVPVSTGTYSVIETTKGAYTLTDKVCTKNNQSTGSPVTNGVGSIGVGVDDIISCTFTNAYIPFCGDSVINGNEQCDNGAQNGVACTPAYGQSCNYCSGSCQTVTVHGPYCGDRNVDTSEQCDDGNVVNGDGCSATCQAESGTLTVIKHVINDNGGNENANDFTFKVNGGSSITFTQSTDNLHAKNDLAVNAGTYNIVEDPFTGYATTYSNCSNIVLGNGGTATCTITNDDIAPALHLRKIVNNDNGGTALATEWTLYANGPTPLSHTTPADSDDSFSAGTYTFTENGPAGYTHSSWVCVGGGSQSGSQGETLALGLGESATCTITNNDWAPRLRLNKILINDNGGEAVLSDFILKADGTGSNDLSGTSPVSSGDIYGTLKADTFTLSETGPAGYAAGAWVCIGGTQVGNQITIKNNEEATCTITNDDIAPTLSINKVCLPSSNGLERFNLQIDGSNVTTDTVCGGSTNGQIEVTVGTHTVGETGGSGTNLSNYTSVISGDCAPNGSVTLAAGDNKVCTITNTKLGSITGQKYEDLNGNGAKGAGEPGVQGWTIKLYNETGNGLLGTTTTDAQGNYTFINILGNYQVCEVNQTNWVNTDPGGGGQGGCKQASVAAGQDTVVNFGNFHLGEVSGFKFEDLNSDGSHDGNEQYLDNWQIRVYKSNGQGGWHIIDSLMTGHTGTTGQYLSTGLWLGTYRVCEVLQPGWIETYPQGGVGPVAGAEAPICKEFYVTSSGQTFDGDFGNMHTGTITIIKDSIPNNGQDFNFSTTGGLGSFILDDDGNNNNTRSNTKILNDVAAGTYTITEGTAGGWKLTNLVCDDGNGSVDLSNRSATINLEAGENITCTFTNTKLAEVWGFKFNDKNANGNWNLLQGEFGLGNWKIFIDQNANQTYDSGEPYDLTSNFILTRGFYEFEHLLPGTYTLCEEMQSGWTNTTPLCQNVNLTPGDIDHFVDFGNVQLSDIHGYKWDDENGNGIRDCGLVDTVINEFTNFEGPGLACEPLLGGWTVNLYQWDKDFNDWGLYGSDITDENGWYVFENLLPGNYKVCEVQQAGWNQTFPGGSGCHEFTLPNNSHATVNEIVGPEYDFGNQESKPEISIEKSNDKPNASAGDTVNYSLVVTNSGNVAINNVIVTDFLPGGFSYAAGTTKIDGVASSDPGVTGSKLEWSVGTIDVGNSLTITYRIQVANDASNGTYKNFATCHGGVGGAVFRIAFDQVEDSVNCNEDDSTVTIGSGTSYGGNLTTNINQQVLGASTELPGTGSPTVLLIIALGALGAGLFIRGYNIKISKKTKGPERSRRRKYHAKN
jgi:uncharacterized repeat protein (TIGR01451 family)